jgi:hypothetical protein
LNHSGLSDLQESRDTDSIDIQTQRENAFSGADGPKRVTGVGRTSMHPHYTIKDHIAITFIAFTLLFIEPRGGF